MRDAVFAGALAVLVSMAAGATEVKYDYDGEADFSSYESFAWKDDGRDTPNPLAAKRISASLERGFAERGFAMASTLDEADFLVDFEASLQQALRIDETFWGVRRRRGWVREIDVTTYPVGSLAVVVLDAGSREIVWRGVVTGAVIENREKMQKRIDKAVKRLLKKFPPPE